MISLRYPNKTVCLNRIMCHSDEVTMYLLVKHIIIIHRPLSQMTLIWADTCLTLCSNVVAVAGSTILYIMLWVAV